MSGLEEIVERLNNMTCDRNRKRYTTGMSPHKPLLLLSLIILNDSGKVDLTDIKPDLDLRDTWNELWGSLNWYRKPGSLQQPLYYMKRERLLDVEFREWKKDIVPRSLKAFQGSVRKISMSKDIRVLLEDEGSRNTIINTLLNAGYFSRGQIRQLEERIKEIEGSFEYEKVLNEKIGEEFRIERWDTNDIPDSRRDPAFRRIVLRSYNETCAICGMRLQTANGVTVVEASHIIPHREYAIDDIRNGVALCKTHHWLFDHGILGIDEDNRILVSSKLEREQPKKVVSEFRKENLWLPNEKRDWPHPSATEWHREKLFMK